MKTPKISIIIIYTNDNQLSECNKWIDKQTYQGEIEKIILDNRGNKAYTSAAQALNDGANKATGEVLFFMHQDIYLWDLDAIKNIVEYLIDKKDTIVGAAGIDLRDFQAHFDIKMKDDPHQLSWTTNGECIKAYTLDECLLVMSRETYEKYKFDEITCDNWHCYGADICLANYLAGGENIIFPLSICHDSFGLPESEAFIESSIKLTKKYQGKIKRLTTTCIDCKCSEKGVKVFFKKKFRRERFKNFLKKIGLFKIAKKINYRRKKRKGQFVLEEDE